MIGDQAKMAATEPLSSMLPPNLEIDTGVAVASDSRSTPRKPQGSAISPSRTVSRKDPRYKSMSPKSGTATAKDAATFRSPVPLTSRNTRPPTATAGRPFVPMTGRKSHGEKATLRTRKGSDADKWEVTPDGGSAGREGRQFAVANVGNNGRIYLRPTVRPAHQRYPPPSFVFPITPPGTGGLNAAAEQGTANKYEGSELHTSLWTPTSDGSPFPGRSQYFNEPPTVQRPPRHRRALSDSTVQEPTPVGEDENGAFKIIISKPGDDKRPKTMEDADPLATPVLDIRIPSWRIGTPWFTSRGPMLRGSSYAPTEEYRNSGLSLLNRSHKELTTPRRAYPSRRPSALNVQQLRSPAGKALPSPSLRSPALPSPGVASPRRETFMSTHVVIEPAMFDALTFKPTCDDRHVVRYATVSSAVTAATPPRLVAEITSPSFLDYELISDFFLTYRSFLEPEDLLRMLVARLRWAMARDDETGMVVRVRTFVALRHWILNYFMDDFVVDYGLRVTFCDLLNEFVDELSQDARSRKVQLKILTELKKCWRRVCAHYWDGPDFDDTLASTVPIAPGGIAGHRDPSLDPAFWDQEEHEAQVPQLESFLPFGRSTTGPNTFLADVSKAGRIADSAVMPMRPTTPENQMTAHVATSSDPDFGPGSPFSMTSMDVISCSFPGKALRSLNPHGGHPLAAHPATSSSIYNQTGPVAQTPRALVGKRVRPRQQHQRENSSGSSRERGSDKVSIKDKEFVVTPPHAGSIVRGNLFPPAKGFVDFPAPHRPGDEQRQTTILHPHRTEMTQGHRAEPDAMSSKGMKRLIGSVRRALSTRGQALTPSTHSLIAMEPIGPRGATTNRLPGTAVVPTQSKRNGTRPPPVRIDLLGAEVAEDFKRVVREDAAAEAEQYGLAIMEPPNSAPLPARDHEYSAAHMSSFVGSSTHELAKNRPFSDTGMTNGSKSILIMDDTLPPLDRQAAPRAPPTVNSSIEDFADHFVVSGANPAPFTHTEATDIPRRSSFLLNQHVQRPSPDEDAPPPFVPDLETLGRESSEYVPSTAGDVRPPTSNREPRRPPLSGAHFHKHMRNKSSKTQQSLNSILLKRRASFSSGLVPPSMIQSVGATTNSEGSLPDHDPDVAVPEPLRILRRRPGGDLRKATNIGDLDYVALRRSRSVGSMTAYSDSMRSFMHGTQADSGGTRAPPTSDLAPQDRTHIFSVGQLADKPKLTDSFFERHSSRAVMRPSFEAEAARLAQIPDDEDDGGIESALLKLEGKYEKKSPSPSTDVPSRLTTDSHFDVAPENIGVAIGDPDLVEQEKKDHRHCHVDEGAFVPDVPEHNLEESPEPTEPGTSYLDVPDRPLTGQQSFLSEGSQESYSSIPLLERDMNEDIPAADISKGWADRSVLQGSDDEVSVVETEKGQHQRHHLSFDFIHKTGSMEQNRDDQALPPKTESASFLDDESLAASDLSSEISEDAMTPHPLGHEPYASRPKLPVHPLGDPPPPPPTTKPPSPPMTSVKMIPSNEEPRVTPELHMDQIWPRTPTMKVSLDALPSNAYSQPTPPLSDPSASPAFRDAPQAFHDNPEKYSMHLPFILAFESDILAQQFTLIEKDALNEIDWKDLIEMNWKNSGCTDYRSWVDFLRNADARGVEVVVARFNLMVKWAISEVVLTKNLEERARCVIKFIHIAAHCRAYRNFATMAQLTMALCSNEVSRLPLTWAMVPAKDMKTLQDLEGLVTPTRNFYNLRAEMEAGSDAGCIPFVGIYTHDLLFNAQRPSEIASSPTTPPLVNFERCRIGAAVVKTLLRLLEASTRYDFKPIEGITERCLWMGALSDDDIRRHSQTLE